MPFSGNIWHQNSGYFKPFCTLYGYFYRNYFDTNFTFKADLGITIDSTVVQDDIFYDMKDTCLIKHCKVKQLYFRLKILNTQPAQ